MVLHFFLPSALHQDARLRRRCQQAGVQPPKNAELCFNVDLAQSYDSLPKDTKEIFAFLLQTRETESTLHAGESERIVEVGPRQAWTTPWCTNALSIFETLGVTCVKRVEVSRRYLIANEATLGSPGKRSHQEMESGDINLSRSSPSTEVVESLYDRMTEEVYPSTGLTEFIAPGKPAKSFQVPRNEKDLIKFSREHGLGFDAHDIQYYQKVFDEEGRDPWDVELFDLAQGNSEHSRHWFFGGKQIIDSEEQKDTLFQMVKRPLEMNKANSVLAFCDNSSALRGYELETFTADTDGNFSKQQRNMDVTYTCETHNFPCGISPDPGAGTGVGGRIRDGESTGKGSLVTASVAGYACGDLHIPGMPRSWEKKDWEYPTNMASPLQILIECSDGASDYGNKFGEPIISGFTRVGAFDVNGERREWIKPIMLSGGLGLMDHGHLYKETPRKDQLIVKVGGPAYRIGVGGGAASSMAAGDNKTDLDFNAVQRGDAEMAQKVDRVIRACVHLKEDNPILSIHDQGAGGSGNVLKEISEPAGACIEMAKMLSGDPSLSAREHWVAEYQENVALLLKPESLPLFTRICERERTSFSVVGTITGDERCSFVSADGDKVVDVSLDKVLGKMPQKVFASTRKEPQGHDVVMTTTTPIEEDLLKVLSLATVGSKRFLTNKVDRSVTGLIAQQQCVGPFHTPLANVAVTALSHLEKKGSAVSLGEQPLKGLSGAKKDLEAMARHAVAEALMNLVFVKISALQDVKLSGNWMWAAKLENEGARMYDCCRALRDVCEDFGIAVDGGKDSLSMAAKAGEEMVKAPGQLVVSAYVTVPDVTAKVTPDLSGPPGSVLLFVDFATNPVLHGTAWAQAVAPSIVGAPGVSDCDVPALKNGFLALQELIPVVLAGHDRSDGGLIGAICEMAIAGGRGVALSIPESADLRVFLFSEGPGVVLEVLECDVKKVTTLLPKAIVVGKTVAAAIVRVEHRGNVAFEKPLKEISDAWESTSFAIEKFQVRDPSLVDQEMHVIRKVPQWHLTYVPRVPSAGKTRPLVGIVREEGSNGDREMATSFYLAGFQPVDVMMTDLLEKRQSFSNFRGLAFVGGFSFADVFGSARGWAAKFRYKLLDEFKAFFARDDTFSLGVCNGCQLMALLWDLIENEEGKATPEFTHNRSARYESRFVNLKIGNSPADKVWTTGMSGSALGCIVAHGEGRATFDNMPANATPHIAMQYCDDDGAVSELYPYCPNGSYKSAAAICSANGRHFAMMPHPERLTVQWQWPWVPAAWKELKASPWLQLFHNARTWCDED